MKKRYRCILFDEVNVSAKNMRVARKMPWVSLTFATDALTYWIENDADKARDIYALASYEMRNYPNCMTLTLCHRPVTHRGSLNYFEQFIDLYTVVHSTFSDRECRQLRRQGKRMVNDGYRISARQVNLFREALVSAIISEPLTVNALLHENHEYGETWDKGIKPVRRMTYVEHKTLTKYAVHMIKNRQDSWRGTELDSIFGLLIWLYNNSYGHFDEFVDPIFQDLTTADLFWCLTNHNQETWFSPAYQKNNETIFSQHLTQTLITRLKADPEIVTLDLSAEYSDSQLHALNEIGRQVFQPAHRDKGYRFVIQQAHADDIKRNFPKITRNMHPANIRLIMKPTAYQVSRRYVKIIQFSLDNADLNQDVDNHDSPNMLWSQLKTVGIANIRHIRVAYAFNVIDELLTYDLQQTERVTVYMSWQDRLQLQNDLVFWQIVVPAWQAQYPDNI